ncbi:MAG: hypothetical protein AAFS07_07240 [Pseudomonadota bacterium]
MSAPPEAEPSAQAAASGPLSDILFGLLATLLALVFLLIPLAGVTPEGEPVEVQLMIDGQEAPVIVLGSEGVYLGDAGGGRTVPTDLVHQDPAFGRLLRGWDAAGQVPIFVIAPEGHEALFVAEARAADEGVRRIATMRLSEGAEACAHVKPAWRQAAPQLCSVGRNQP